MRNAKILLISLSLLLVTNLSHATATTDSSDPYSAIEHITLPNGTQVFLAPSEEAKLTSVRLEVGVGWEAETRANWGVSHLLEHVLFRDKQLKDEMTYLQLIREAGGQANGGTSRRETNYHGSIPADKGAWLLDSIAKMILEPSIGDEYVAKEKGTVELERGRPGPITQVLGFNPADYLYPKYLRQPDFYESEFGLNYDENFTLADEQLSTQRLTTEKVQQHYQDYYYPSNMKLFVAGKFKRDEIMKIINSKWGALPAREGKKLAAEPAPKPNFAPYRRLTITTETPYVSLGTKLSGASVLDDEILSSYSEYLAHRLMKEIRNIKGQTYTASGSTYVNRGIGYSTIQFQTTRENLTENLALVKKLMHDEAVMGSLTDEQVKESVELYMSKYKLRGNEADMMMTRAQTYESIVTETGKFTSPYESLKNATTEEYNASLKKFFQPNMAYESVSQPPVFFHYDTYFMYFFSAVFSFMGLRRLLTQKFPNDRLRWVRKVQYPPLKLLEGFVLALGAYAFVFVQYGIGQVFNSSVMQSTVLLSQYLHGALWTFSLILILQGFFSLLPRKLMVVENDLLVKSVTYYSRRIPLEQIASVETCRSLGYPFPLSRWAGSVRWRMAYFNPLFWQKGLLINLKNGKSYYFSMSNAEKAKAELAQFIPTQAPTVDAGKTEPSEIKKVA